ncbi:uncharacterized protein LOC118743241 isoform X2 [Rhagoletis pomonella]|uniref:uncharacterized protein LOC118743240 n=1 Tax=Rhagoletis pomonella TaxID=28610 RepID=UPI00177AA492|nr:uncharacterized protein LOC118743240 [Rhagoletis pomonella]XP_036331696.1 uncharacterized protein LOC118743241 isoform X2 [Rhagoletis pomonella]
MVNKQYSATDLEAFMKIAVNWQNSNHNLLEGVDIKGEMQQYMNSPAMNMYKKRERTQNWNHQEKKFLLDLCRKDMRIIENKRLDAGLTAVKNKAWKIIHQKFSSQFGTDRTCNRLKEQWRRMKACTRNEILDYNNRLARFGAEVADRKKPSPFTFEVWEFMQEAKKACKSEALDGIDYSKIPLALEEDYEYREDEQNGEDDHDMDDSRTPPQELCDVDIKEETNETFNDTVNNHHESLAAGERRPSSSSPNLSRLGAHDLERASLHSPAGNLATASELTNPSFLTQNGASGGGAAIGGSAGDMGAFQPAFNMSNISATLEALNALRTGQFPSAAAAAAAALQNNFAAAAAQQHSQQHQQQQQMTTPSSNDQPLVKRPRSSSGSGNGEEVLHDLSMNGAAAAAIANTATSQLGGSALGIAPSSTPEMRAFMDMQSKEHLMRMKILEVQLQAAKYSRDLVEINKTLALQKLQELASKRLTS